LTRAEEPVVRRLCAGGNQIRTIGSAVEETPFPTPDVSFRANGSDLRHSLRGTEGSNPLPSSGESCKLHFASLDELSCSSPKLAGKRRCPRSRDPNGAQNRGVTKK